eukprot:NODE_5923_length_593_cov_17.710300_g5758_i0.p1 GENE.NODE_5923_length_593_cov_17.710300_g5758_i0~~NODE_5923_length_593_cov_17.710300_g5758_i0.p1  ORF type:complete len:176 (-),score=37.58 NODE_5923_length_593_cov_17.710300_g5758_i0:64-591(-)
MLSCCFSLSRRPYSLGPAPAHILVGLSATIYGDLAIRSALRLATPGDKVTGIYIPPVLPSGYAAAPPHIRDTFIELQNEMMVDVLRRAEREALAAKLLLNKEIDFETRALDPSSHRQRALVQAATTLKGDMLVLGAKGRETFQNQEVDIALLPSYAVNHAPCPVLVVRLDSPNPS